MTHPCYTAAMIDENSTPNILPHTHRYWSSYTPYAIFGVTFQVLAFAMGFHKDSYPPDIASRDVFPIETEPEALPFKCIASLKGLANGTAGRLWIDPLENEAVSTVVFPGATDL